MNNDHFKRQQLAHTHVIFLVCSSVLFIRSMYEDWDKVAMIYGGVFIVTLFFFWREFGARIKTIKVSFLDLLFTILFIVGFLMILISGVGFLWLFLLGVPFYFFSRNLSRKINNE